MVHLSQIQKPADIKLCSYDELDQLAAEIRREIVMTVSRTGGHLASNLGVVELTLAVHRMFNAPEDKILFDVGHQCYVHKLLTGRYASFSKLRQNEGISGFPKRDESVYDCFETGHASTAISAALGFARARDMQHQDHHVLAIVGDGALTGGLCYEAMNDAGNDKTKLIIILNDNEMSIARNVGALATHLTNLRASRGWNKVKRTIENSLSRLPVAGPKIQRVLSTIKNSIKGLVVDEGFFAALGFHYLGPIDGHNLQNLEYTIAQAKEFDEPVLIHCITKKGHGYQQAEKRPEVFHGTPPFFMDSGDARSQSSRPSYGEIAARELIKFASQEEKTIAITAAMPAGTGLHLFAKAFPKRMLDVGIAEQHAVTLAAGLASGGMRPYFAVYASFLQRGYDQTLHDVCLQNLPVCFLLDRAGLAGEDGATHHGIYDIAYLRHMPNMTVLAPRDEQELCAMMEWTRNYAGPCAIRYPRKSIRMEDFPLGNFSAGRWEIMQEGKDCALLAVGAMVPIALETAKHLSRLNINARVVNASTIKPLDHSMLRAMKDYPVFTLEEHVLTCGFGSAVAEFCITEQQQVPAAMFGIPDKVIHHGNKDDLLSSLGLVPEQIAAKVKNTLASTGKAKP